MMRIVQSLAVLTVTVFMAISSRAAFNDSEFNALPSKERFELAISMLDKHDLTLANFKCKVDEQVVNIAADNGAPQFIIGSQYEIRRLDKKIFGINIVHSDAKTMQGVRMKSERAWNGGVFKSLGFPPYDGQAYHVGQIDAGESWTINQIKLYNILGLRGLKINYIAGTLARWIEHERDIQVNIESQAKDNLVSIMVETGPKHKITFYLDSARDFMICRMTTSLEGKTYTVTDTVEVTESQKVEGAWIPRRITEKMIDSSKPYQQVTTFDFVDIAVGSVTEDQVAVEFPVGAHVADSTQRINYVINPDGTFRLNPIASVAEDVVRVPMTQQVAKIDDATSNLYKDTPIVHGAKTTPDPTITTARVLLLSSSLFLVGGILLYWLRKTRRQRLME
jgi:hypothetical protein